MASGGTMIESAEWAMPGHPDKVCDQISDAILDEYLGLDPMSRVAIETMGGHRQIHLTGEITSKADVSGDRIAVIVRDVLNDIGYSETYALTQNIVKQSPDIAQGVDSGGAGDNGIMVGFASRGTDNLMPEAITIARRVGSWVYLKNGYGPDGKVEVILDNGKVKYLVICVMTKESPIEQKEVEDFIGKKIENYYFNPTGKFEIGGFDADTGLTGRKIVADAYGPMVQVGGGAFSGKDPTKVDRSAAYAARQLARELLMCNEGMFKDIIVRITYAIGKAEPLDIDVMGVGYKIGVQKLEADKSTYESMKPENIINRLDLRKPIYQDLAKWGHFGRPELKWESDTKNK